MISKKEAAAELLRRRAARKELGAYICYATPGYVESQFSRTVCQALDKFIADMQKGIRPILILQAPPQHGKQMSDDTPVLTTGGWSTHGSLVAGDYVFSPSGKAIKVVATSEKTDSTHRVELTDGSVFYCHANHEWTVRSRNLRREVTIDTGSMLASGQLVVSGVEGSRGSRFGYQLPHIEPLIGIPCHLPVAPYTLGAWLGDGTRVAPRISGDWRDIEIINAIVEDGYPVRSMWAHKTTHVITTSFDNLWADLKTAGVTSKPKRWIDKKIPDIYFIAPIEARLELLAGLIDTDGYVYQKNGRIVFTTAEKSLADSVEKLVATFGWRTTTVVEQPKTSSSGIVGRKEYYVVGFNPTFEIPCRLDRKKIKTFSKKRRVAIKSITVGDWGKIGNCIQVDSDDGLYLVGNNLVPTHNSEIVSRKLPSFLLGMFPDWRIAAASYSATLADSMSLDVRRNLVAPEHLRLFPSPDVKKKYAVDRNGEFSSPGGTGGYIGDGIGGGFTGKSADIFIIDDPIKNAQEALSPTTKASHWNWYQSTCKTRMSANSGQIIMATSWAEDDLPASIAALHKGDPRLTILRFPAINEPTESGYNPQLPRGPLVPELHPLEQLLELKAELSDYWWSAIYQQSPKSIGGNVFKEAGLRYYLPKDLPAKFDKVIASLDATFKDTDGTDYVVGQVWGKLGANSYLLAQSRARMSFTKTVAEVIKIKRDHPNIRQFYIEDKANGPAVIDTLKGVVPGLVPVEPDGSKLARAHAVTSYWEAGNVWLPHPDLFPWVKELVAELTAFPAAVNDDQVDALTQALRRLYPLFNTLKISQAAIDKAMGR